MNDSGKALHDADCGRLRELLARRAGLRHDLASRQTIEQRLSGRLEALNLSSFWQYANLLSQPGSETELAHALEALTTGETYFFRNRPQLDLVAKVILPELAARRAESRRLNIWSAGCSSGEEAYTLAMLVDSSGLFEGWRVSILGSDVSPGRLERAAAGVYARHAFRAMEPSAHPDWFEASGSCWRVRPRLKRWCEFTPFNLLDHPRSAFIGRMDLVACRNVLIYLGPEARAAVLRTLQERLSSGGYLLLGHSEQLDPQVELRPLESNLAYLKPAIGSGRQRAPQ